MKLAIVTASYPFGVTEAFLVPELEALAEWGWDVSVVPVWGRGSRRKWVPVSTIDAIRKPGHPAVLLDAIRSIRRRPGALAVAGHAIARSGGWRASVTNTLLAPSGLALGRVLQDQGFDHVHAYWATGAATVAMIAAEVSGLPWSFTGHRWDVKDDRSLPTKLRSAVLGRFISTATRDLALGNLRASGLSLERATTLLETKSVVRRLGVAIPDVAPGPGRAPRLLCAANLVPVKGHRVLLEAMVALREMVPDVQLDVAGRGPLKETLMQRATELGLDGMVRFLGAVPHQDLLSEYAAGTYAAVVLPSLDLGNGMHEGIPVSLMEAMAFGVPVISTATGGIPELVVADCGWLVPPGDPVALAKALGVALSGGAQARAVGARGRARVEACFSIRASVREFWQDVRSRAH